MSAAPTRSAGPTRVVVSENGIASVIPWQASPHCEAKVGVYGGGIRADGSRVDNQLSVRDAVKFARKLIEAAADADEVEAAKAVFELFPEQAPSVPLKSSERQALSKAIVALSDRAAQLTDAAGTPNIAPASVRELKAGAEFYRLYANVISQMLKIKPAEAADGEKPSGTAAGHFRFIGANDKGMPVFGVGHSPLSGPRVTLIASGTIGICCQSRAPADIARELTPAEARQYARQLVEAAERAEEVSAGKPRAAGKLL